MMNNALSDPLSLTKVAKQPARDQITSMARTGEQEQLATSNLGKLESQKNIDVAKIKAAETGRQAEGATSDITQAKEQLAASPEPEFKPSQETFIGMSTLAGLIAFVGSSAGKYGSQSGRAAIDSMTGMMKGYQTGRQDVFRREQIQFEKELQTIKAKNEKIYKQLELAEKTRAVDAAKGNAMAAVAVAEAESPLLRAKYDKQGLTETFKLQKEIFDATQKMEKMAQELGIAQMKSRGSGSGVALPKDKEAIKQYTTRFQMIKNVEDIESLLQDPKYRKLISVSTAYMPDVLQNLQTNFPEISQKLARIQAMEFEVGGKALTQSEQKILGPIYNWRGLTPKALEQRLKGVKESLQENVNISEEVYPGFKTLRPRLDALYEKTGKVADIPTGTGQNEQEQALKQFGSYDPDKYNYGFDEKGFYRETK